MITDSEDFESLQLSILGASPEEIDETRETEENTESEDEGQ